MSDIRGSEAAEVKHIPPPRMFVLLHSDNNDLSTVKDESPLEYMAPPSPADEIQDLNEHWVT